jgi:hypothetical protein
MLLTRNDNCLAPPFQVQCGIAVSAGRLFCKLSHTFWKGFSSVVAFISLVRVGRGRCSRLAQSTEVFDMTTRQEQEDSSQKSSSKVVVFMLPFVRCFPVRTVSPSRFFSKLIIGRSVSRNGLTTPRLATPGISQERRRCPPNSPSRAQGISRILSSAKWLECIIGNQWSPVVTRSEGT